MDETTDEANKTGDNEATPIKIKDSSPKSVVSDESINTNEHEPAIVGTLNGVLDLAVETVEPKVGVGGDEDAIMDNVQVSIDEDSNGNEENVTDHLEDMEDSPINNIDKEECTTNIDSPICEDIPLDDKLSMGDDEKSLSNNDVSQTSELENRTSSPKTVQTDEQLLDSDVIQDDKSIDVNVDPIITTFTPETLDSEIDGNSKLTCSSEDMKSLESIQEIVKPNIESNGENKQKEVDNIQKTSLPVHSENGESVQRNNVKLPQHINSFYNDINEVLNDMSTSDEVKFGLLCTKILAAMSNNTIHVNEINLITDNILKLLITDDMQRIKKPETLRIFFCDYLKMLPSKVVAEILSVLIAVLKKSILNLEFSKDLLLVAITQTFHLDNLIKHFIREIINLQTTYSCNVKELIAILKLSEDDPRLLHYIRNANLYKRNRPNSFFAFPGINGSVLALPPFQKWPIQNGWTFVTWFRLESNSTNSQPYLYYFRTSKSGVGYSAHFTGNCLVLTSMKIKGKGFQHCIPFEFTPHKWFHCAITYVTKWRSAEVKVYVNGQLTANTEMAWQVQTSDHFDKCYIGGTPDLNDTYLFSGQIASIYLFHEALNPSQICSIHRLGPSYSGEYKHSNESQIDLPIGIKRVLYEEKLSSAVFCLYTPVAVESDTLCLQSMPKGNVSYFTSSPHAALMSNAKAIRTYSISNTLQSIGGIRALLPLLFKFSQKNDSEACSTLIGFICDLLEFSPQWFGNEMIQSHGFVTIASILSRNSRLLINSDTLEVLLNLTKTLISTSSNNDALILKQMLDNVLFNPSLWVYVDAKIQLKLYCYLSNEFLNGANTPVAAASLTSISNGGTLAVLNGIIFNEVRRISTVLQLLHSLKYYYWLVEEKSYTMKATEYSLRPTYDELETIRSYILLFIKQLIIKGNGIHLDELQSILNYLTTVNEDANVIDVLQMLQSLMCEHPSSLIPAFDAKHGVQTIFKLLSSGNEEIRIQSLKLLGYFLSRSTQKRKQDVMGPHNLYMLLCEHLMRFTPLTINTYNALFEILTETSIESIRIANPCNSVLKIENPMILKVIATLLIDGKRDHSEEKSSIKDLFINDLWSLLINNRENRRLVLQMSVWQHWLINLIESKNDLITNQILAIFRILLYHAIKYEFGGWRVWIDTLAIIHAKISFDDFNEQFGKTNVRQSNSQTYMDAYLIESRKKSMESLKSNHVAMRNDAEQSLLNKNKVISEEISNTKQEVDDPRPEDDRELNVNSKKVSETEKKDETKDEVDKADENESTEANDERNEPVICTISSIQNESVLPNETESKENNSTSDNGSLNQESTDAAPNRKNRYDSSTHPKTVSNLGDENVTKTSTKVKVSATPAFRIPEFRWSNLHLKLLNDLLFSIEADLQVWRNQSSEFKLDASNGKMAQIDQLLQSNDNQIYIINTIHLVSQLCDNVIISSGGLLPLLASATGGSGTAACITIGGEGFIPSQANFLIYRLANLIDILCFAASHVSFTELEAEKNMSSGGILRQCLRIVCTIAVKNCLLLQKHQSSNFGNCHEFELISDDEYLYKGVSIISSAELFAVDFNPELSDLISYKTVNLDIDNLHYQLITPIKDATSLLQEMDINRLRACIYRDADSDTRQSQFLALATLYFISVLMVSKYRDIIEPKNNEKSGMRVLNDKQQSNSNHEEANHSALPESIDISKNNLNINMSEKLTAKLEATLASICPLLKEIICDFAPFLSKTLLGSHGQELITKEAIRTFKKVDASPVELVMLLCSQEWQNTLQKNAGLAFIELINEGRLLSHAMKDHIVRVAMEAEFILNRLRADDVSKHDAFTNTCMETNNSRLQEENIINSLIISAKRRDWMIFTRFKESIRHEERKFFKLDSWEDDSRRRRRFVYDSLGDLICNRLKSLKHSLNDETVTNNETEKNNNEKSEKILSSPIVPPRQVSNSSVEDDDSDSFGIWENEDTMGDTETTSVEFSSSVLYSVECCLIWAIYTIEGVLQITSNEIFFEANNSNDIDLHKSNVDKRKADLGDSFRGLSGIGPKGLKEFKDWDLIALQYCDLLTYNGKISFSDIRAIFTRRYLLQQNALEVFLSQRTSVMFAFPDFDTVKKVVRYLPPVGVGVKYGIAQSRRASLMTPKQLFASSNMTQRWQKREISNFEYLMFLNTIAGRTYQDLNQYHVFPWILTNYDGKELDLSQPTNFRDLSKPIGALNSERREEFIERYGSWDNNLVPAFHYGTHYSTAAFTLGWLIRIQPFASIYLSLQDGSIEDESRLFTSVRDSWISSLMGGQQNVKELIPEFFYLPELFYRNGGVMADIDLPQWAESPEHFIRIHRTALESDLVSCQLHQWIDLIFGYKQRGPEAVRAVNVFYYLTYEGNIDLSSITDPPLREAIESQIRHFGQTPSQLTTDPHPPRSSALHVSPLMFSSSIDELCMNLKFPFNAPVVHISACIGSNHVIPSGTSLIVTINAHQQYFMHKWNVKDASSPLQMDTALTSSSANIKRQLVDINGLCSYLPCNYVVTIDAKYIIMCPFYDNSFRVYSTETGRLVQIIYGHKGIVTCLARSECNIASDFYLVSGSKDCSVLLWTWNAKYSLVEGNGNFNSTNPLPKLTLCGHESAITSLLISAELGIIVSSSSNRILIHTTIQGECITDIDFRCRNLTFKMRSLSRFLEGNSQKVVDANIEASMIGKEGLSVVKSTKSSDTSGEITEKEDQNSNANKIALNLDDNEYLITNLTISRELGFIIGIAIPDTSGQKKPKRGNLSNSSYLFTYNLKGILIKCIEINGNIKDRESIILQTSRDGEYIILTENCNTIKILRAFDLTPLYAFTTSDATSNYQLDKIRSLNLVDLKYLLVGLENGKFLVYNTDFNRWNHEYNNRY